MAENTQGGTVSDRSIMEDQDEVRLEFPPGGDVDARFAIIIFMIKYVKTVGF